jgi:hypothetical protein
MTHFKTGPEPSGTGLLMQPASNGSMAGASGIANERINRMKLRTSWSVGANETAQYRIGRAAADLEKARYGSVPKSFGLLYWVAHHSLGPHKY